MLPKEKGIPAPIVRSVEEMYNGATITVSVRTECGVSAEFSVTLGSHSGSALSLFLFVVVLGVSGRIHMGAIVCR